MKQVPPSEAVEAKYPERVTIVMTVDVEGTANVIPLAWVTQASGDPLRFAVAIDKRQHSHRLLSECGEFVLAFPDVKQVEEVLFCGTRSGRKVNKELESGFEFAPSTSIAPPLVRGCLANLECKLVSQHDAGDHTLFVGEVVAAHVEEAKTGVSDGLQYLGSGAFCRFERVERLDASL